MSVDARVVKVASLADTELVCESAADEFLDVRKSAVRSLRHFPSIDLVRETLRGRYEALRVGGDESERGEIVKSLAVHGLQDKGIRMFLQDELLRNLDHGANSWGERRRSLITRLMHACEQLGASLSARGSLRLYEVATDFRTPADVRRLAIRVYGGTASATGDNGVRVLSLLERQPRAERLAAYKGAGAFADRCKGSVSTVRLVRPALEKLRAALIAKWGGESKGLRDRIDFSGLRDIRQALLSIEEILTSYDEFSSRMKVSDFEKQANLQFSAVSD